MRFGLKIFLMAFTLVIITINIIGINLINNTYQTNINNAIEKHIVEINNIMNSVIYYSPDNIISSYYTNGTYTKIYINNEIFSTNFPENYPEIETKLMSNLGDDIHAYINNNQIFLAHKNNNYTVITMSDISNIYENRTNQIHYFINLSLISSFLVSIILSGLVFLITHKIKRLQKTVKELENGHYNTVIPKLGHDEIGEFATSFAKMTASINKNIEEIEAISENRRVFIGNLTHEIRTPLTSIIGYSSLIKNKKVTDLETIINYSAKINEEGKYIENMRDKLMHILTLETSSIKLQNKNISNLLKSYINELKLLYKGTIFISEIESDINKEIDETLFKSLIFNLVKNGINAAPTPEIKIVLTKKILTIADNGCGIPETEIEKIKEPFYTLNKNRNRSESGMGLGIPLVLNIIKLHDWNFNIKSQEQKGTKIEIIFTRSRCKK